MKKGLAILLALVMVFSLVACGSDTPTPTPENSPSATPSAEPSAKPSTEPSVKPSAEPSPEPSKEPDPEPGEVPSDEPAFTSADLVGTWILYAWDLTVGGMYTVEANDFFIFTEKDVTYVDNNLKSGVWHYQFNDPNSMVLVGGTTTAWDLSYGENGELVITDPLAYIVYYCYREGQEIPEAPVDPGSNPEEDSFTTDDLVGTWILHAWDLTVGGMYTEEENDFFVFTENAVDYIDNNAAAGSWSYVFTDHNSMALSGDPDTVWNLSYNEDGYLVITDPAAFIVYYCVKEAAPELGEEPEPQPSEEPDPQPSEEPDPQPSEEPDPQPSEEPDPQPSEEPDPQPSEEPDPQPSEEPDPQPSEEPDPQPSEEPDPQPSEEPDPQPSEEPEPQPSEEPEVPAEPAKVQDPYLGTWEVYAWCLYDYTMYTPVTDQQFIFTEDKVEYIVSGASSGVWDYTARVATPEENSDVVFTLTAPTGSDVWYFVNQEDGSLLIYDSALFIFYYCSKAV